jgi:hypothetical protein
MLVLAASAAWEGLRPKSLSLFVMSMFVKIYVRPNSSMDDDARRDRLPRSILRYINKPRLVSKLFFFKLFSNSFSRNFKMRGDGKHDDRHDCHDLHDDEQVWFYYIECYFRFSGWCHELRKLSKSSRLLSLSKTLKKSIRKLARVSRNVNQKQWQYDVIFDHCNKQKTATELFFYKSNHANPKCPITTRGPEHIHKIVKKRIVGYYRSKSDYESSAACAERISLMKWCGTHIFTVIHLTWICKMTSECNKYAFSTLSEAVIQLTFKL